MLILLLIHVFALLVGGIFTFLGALLPFQSEITTAFGYVIGPAKALMTEIPYLATLWYAFLSIIVFEVLMMVVKFLLGSRTPRHMN